MASWIWIGFAAFTAVSAAVGVRLLALARRTRQLPELLMAIGVLGIGPVGFGLLVSAQHAADPPLARALAGAGALAVSAGTFAGGFVFNSRVYHPASGAARAIALGGGLLLAGIWARSGVAHGFADLFDAVSPATLQLVTGRSAMEDGWVMASSSLHGLVAAIAIGLAFLPPAAYLRRVRAGAAVSR